MAGNNHPGRLRKACQEKPTRFNLLAFLVFAALAGLAGWWSYPQVSAACNALGLAGGYWGLQHQVYALLSLLVVGALLIFGVLPCSRYGPPANPHRGHMEASQTGTVNPSEGD